MLRFANLVEALEAAPADRPFVTAWIGEDERETVTFGEFRDRTRLEAAALRKNAVSAGERVVIIMPQGIAAMTTFAAAMMLGAVPAFLAYPNFKVEPAKYRSGLAGVTANLSARAVVVDLDFPEDMLECVRVGAETRLLRCGSSTAGQNGEGVEAPNTMIRPDGLAFIQHSAGTTGLQKGVALTDAAVLRQLRYLSEALQIDGSRDRVYSWLPLYHDMGLIACFVTPMVYHVPVVMRFPLDWVMRPETMLQILSDHKCRILRRKDKNEIVDDRRTRADE